MKNQVQHNRLKSGFSLIEILVVLAILVIGVLGILRIFPYGFLAIQRTAEQTNASALANQQLEFEKNALSVPEGIVSMAPDGTINPNILPDNLNPEALDPKNNPTVLASDVNKINYVVGETFRIPLAFASPSGNPGSVYIAQFGPLHYNDTLATDPLNPQATGTPLQRVEQPSKAADGSDTVPTLTSEAQYAIDYDLKRIAFYPRYGVAGGKRVFQFNYTYYTNVGGVPGVTTILSGTNKIVVPDVTTDVTAPQFLPIWQDIFSPANQAPPLNMLPTDMDPNLGIRRESEDVSRAFTFINLAAGAKWSVSDPYEFALAYPNDYGNANVGVFLFNPLGHNESVVTPTGTQPFSARISYQIHDNHIVHDQRALPSVPPYDVRLSLPYISTTGDIQLDQTSFAGLFGGNTSNLLIYNASNGQLITKGSGECLPGTAPDGVLGGADNFTVDAKTGVVHFDNKFIVANNLQNVTLQIYYHTQKDFGLQLQKANAHYYPSLTQTLDYHSYYVAKAGDGNPQTRIYFPKCETGKSVTLGSLNYIDANGDVQHTGGETYQIGNTTAGLPYVDIKDRHGDAMSFVDPANVTLGLMPVDNVQGVSMKARVIWLRSVQITNDATPVTTYHWRKLDNDTILTPNPTH